MFRLNLVAILGDRLADPDSGISVIRGVFDQEANGVQQFVVFHDPKLVGREPIMRIDEAPDYRPSTYRPSSFDPGAPTLFYSGERRRLFSFEFHPWHQKGERLPLALTIAPRRDEAVAVLAGAGVDDPATTLAGVIARTFTTYVPPMKRGGLSQLQLVASVEDARALYARDRPVLDLRGLTGVVVLERDIKVS